MDNAAEFELRNASLDAPLAMMEEEKSSSSVAASLCCLLRNEWARKADCMRAAAWAALRTAASVCLRESCSSSSSFAADFDRLLTTALSASIAAAPLESSLSARVRDERWVVRATSERYPASPLWPQVAAIDAGVFPVGKKEIKHIPPEPCSPMQSSPSINVTKINAHPRIQYRLEGPFKSQPSNHVLDDTHTSSFSLTSSCTSQSRVFHVEGLPTKRESIIWLHESSEFLDFPNKLILDSEASSQQEFFRAFISSICFGWLRSKIRFRAIFKLPYFTAGFPIPTCNTDVDFSVQVRWRMAAEDSFLNHLCQDLSVPNHAGP
ncbi:leucine--tRNA ligase [Striga asiatica]|uniref:Leucine--tRNA ligase n=1 Tax=Striga asiatica TaxID=4170 RepID=A0A5A7QI55_STRAF|nr:leucine--tRNA ligase [Striga asiatica]